MPILFPWIVHPFPTETWMPLSALPEMTFPSPGLGPPMRKPVVPVSEMPSPLEMAALPVTSVPMRLPWMTLAPPPVDWMPVAFPLTRFPAPAVAPPITLPLAPAVMTIPTPFPGPAVPVGSVPMKQPSRWLSFDSIWTPALKSWTHTPRIVLAPVPVMRRPAPLKLESSIRGVPA